MLSRRRHSIRFSPEFEADLAERTVGGIIHRVSYQVTLVGKIRFAAVIIT